MPAAAHGKLGVRPAPPWPGNPRPCRSPRRVALAMRDVAELSSVVCVFVERSER